MDQRPIELTVFGVKDDTPDGVPTLEIPEPHGFTLRDALIGAVVAAALIELAPSTDRTYLSAGIRQPGVKPAHLLPRPKPKLP